MASIIEITDFSAPELDVYARLTQAQLRSRLEPEKGLFIAESTKVIGTALQNGYEPVSLLMERKHITGQAVQYWRPQGVETLRMILPEEGANLPFYEDYGFFVSGNTADGWRILEKRIGFDPEFVGESED